MNIKQNIWLSLIITFSIVLRFVLLNEVAPSLNWDEVSHANNAYSVLTTGDDEWGEKMPTIFRAYGDYKLPVYIYTLVPTIALLGLTEFSVRLPSAIAGVFSVLFTYLLVKKLFEFKKPEDRTEHIALLSAFLMAISPWSLFISRGAFEANLALTFIIGGVYFFLKGLERPAYFLASSTLLGLSVWTYNSARLFIPLLLIFLLILHAALLKEGYIKNKYIVYCSSFVAILFIVPMFLQLLDVVGQARYDKVAILTESSVYEIEERRNTSDSPELLNKLINNRYSYFTWEVVKNWFSHYTPQFLFLEGGTQYQFSVPGHGLLYLVTAPFLVIGIILLIKRRDKTALLLFFWIFAGSLASSITREAPHVLRSVTMLPIPMIITALGIAKFLEIFQKKKSLAPYYLLFTVFIFAMLFSMQKYLYTYFNDYPKTYSWSWQYGYKEVVRYAKEHYNDYDSIITTKKYGEPHAFFLFYSVSSDSSQNYSNPALFRNNPNLIRYRQSEWFWVDRFDKFWFVNDWEIPKEGYEFITESGNSVQCPESTSRCLLITSPNNAPSGWDKINTVQFLDGSPAFELYEN